jgi:hypothetical protein
MKKYVNFIYFFLICFNSLSLAQEETQKFAPPPPLKDEFIKWMVGEWRGITESPMGAANDWMECKLGLGGQFLLINQKSEFENRTVSTAMGALTINKEGEVVGIWIDSWRTISHGKGKHEGNVSIMEWTTPGMGTQTRVMEKLGENNFRILITMKGKDGKEMQAFSEMRRIKKKEKK